MGKKNALQQFGEMRAPDRNWLMGVIADRLTQANEFATKMDPRYADKRQNQTLGIVADAVSLGSLAKTADRMSYGEPLTNARKANVPWLKPETADALMMAPLSPRNALAAASMGLGMADNGAMRAATVWHGSPHKFDKFDASKIGTGEGAQAYGHGLYLAESPKVAESYSGKLSSELKYNGRPMNRESSRNSRDSAAWALYLADGDKEAAKASGLAKPELIDALDPAKLKAGGQLYKVDLPDEHIAKMLDWDAALNNQPANVQRLAKVQQRDFSAEDALIAKAQALGVPVTSLREYAQLEKLMDKAGKQSRMTGRDLYERFGGAAAGADKMRAAGIPGIRYLDGGSRTSGQGSSNFVVFPGNEGLLSILERNGQPLK